MGDDLWNRKIVVLRLLAAIVVVMGHLLPEEMPPPTTMAVSMMMMVGGFDRAGLTSWKSFGRDGTHARREKSRESVG